MVRIKISSKNFKKVIGETVEVIKIGGVAIVPTDTVYGLIADAMNKETVKKVFQIKKRTFKKPIPIFVKDLKMARSLAIINKSQEKFLKKVWPGKATVILKAKNQKFPKGVVSVDKKIGLRISNYKIINQLLLILKCPLTGTSANISGKPESTKIKEILNQFTNQKQKPDLILDAGNLKLSLPSTVIDLETFKILREGEFPREEILKFFRK